MEDWPSQKSRKEDSTICRAWTQKSGSNDFNMPRHAQSTITKGMDVVGTSTSHLCTMHTESKQPTCLAVGITDFQEPPPLDNPAKQGKTLDKLINLLPTFDKQDYGTQARNDKTIDNLISRLIASEGHFKLSWLLSQKASIAKLDTSHQIMISQKACTAVDKPSRLLATKQNLGPNTGQFMVE